MPRGQIMTGQDWEPQVFNFQKKNNANKKPGRVSETEANRVLQRGGNVDVMKKEHFHANAQKTDLGANAKRLDEDTDILKLKRVDNALRINIQRARQAKEWTQQDLARHIAERAGVVTEYESGKAVPEERVLVKMEKALGVHLRGVMAGKPFGGSHHQPQQAKKPA
ncbi:transcription factor [Trypanosoma conorhini]|uniref:Transcription factor n=1 Tax=Trypanosoma conorhini TaxID=83891 RepID=A0A3R7L9P7_9TRYP|nr:transcription factor [Trypanosoma conorhini]RNF19029.1 transcription factor [Trypanosoma conorhini]